MRLRKCPGASASAMRMRCVHWPSRCEPSSGAHRSPSPRSCVLRRVTLCLCRSAERSMSAFSSASRSSSRPTPDVPGRSARCESFTMSIQPVIRKKMSSPDLSSNLSTLKDAVAQFLKSVLGKDVPVDLDRPAPAAEALKTASSIRILHPAVLSPDWYVFVEDAWVPLLSGAMIGEAMMPDQDGADDLLREVATQAFAAVRRALEEKNVVMPEFEMSVQ